MTVGDEYDRLAPAYADALLHELDGKPLDRWLLERVAREAGGPVVEVGCGPGHVTAFLAARGADVRGLDLSPAMIAEARRRFPGLRFEVGDLHALPAGTLGAVVAFYALVHLEAAALRRAIVALAEALAPGGLLLLALHVGEERLSPPELFGVPVSLTWIFHPSDVVYAAVRDAGLELREALVREPYAGAEHASRRAYVLASRPRGT